MPNYSKSGSIGHTIPSISGEQATPRAGTGRWTLVLVTLMLLGSGVTPLPAQQGPAGNDNLTTEKKRLLILPTGTTDDHAFSIAQEVTSTVVGLAVGLGRFEIIDRNNLLQILKEQDLQLLGLVDDSAAVSVGKIASAREALLVTVLDFSQKGVPPSDEDDKKDEEDDKSLGEAIGKGLAKGLWSIVTRKSAPDVEQDPYAHNIQTYLSVEVRSLDVETGQTLYTFRVDATHTGGAAGKSRGRVMKEFRSKAGQELRSYYLLVSRVLSVDNGELILLLGKDMGLRKGMIFAIIEADREEIFSGRVMSIPGRSVGYVAVKDLSAESNRSVILRPWHTVRPGDQAIEQVDRLWAIRLGVAPSLPGLQTPGLRLGIQVLAKSIEAFDYGLGIGYLRTEDSRTRLDQGLNLNGFAGLRFRMGSRTTLMGKLGIDLNLLFRSDDADHLVNAPLAAATLGVDLERLLTPGIDLVLGAGYRFGGKSTSWSYTKEDPESETSKRYDAIWNVDPPEIDLSGPFLTAGFKFIFPGLQ